MERTVTDKELDLLMVKYKGVNGSLEDSESHINASVWELREGYLTIFSDNSTIYRTIKRCRPHILKVEDNNNGFGCRIWMKADSFRGVEFAFKTGNS